MGFFDRFKKNGADSAAPVPPAPAEDSKPLGPGLIESARLISLGDEAVMRDVSACAEAPRDWFEANRERYEERGIDSTGDLDQVQWLGLVDILEEHGWVCERDWKDELEDFLFFLQELKGYQALHLTLDESWLEPDGDIPGWCEILAKKWKEQGARVAAIDIDSDSYVLFPVPSVQLPTLQKLAGETGHNIDFVERM